MNYFTYKWLATNIILWMVLVKGKFVFSTLILDEHYSIEHTGQQ